MTRLSLCFLLALSSPSWGQKLTLPATVKGDPGQFIQVPSDTDCTTIKWFCIDPNLNLFPVDLLKNTKTAIVTGNTPGAYRLMAIGAKADVPTDPAICVVTINGPPVPIVPVNPTPPVPPAPTPTAKGLFLLTIDAWKTRTQATAAVVGDLAYWNGVVAKGHKFASVDSTSPAALEFATLTAKSGLPALVVMELDGTVLETIALPVTTSGVDAEIAKFSSKKATP